MEYHPRLKDIKVPKLAKPGRSVKGPEPLGCFNTGFRPMLLHGWDGYYVGYEMLVDELRRKREFCFKGKKLTILKRNGGFGAKFYKTSASARKRFLEMVSARLFEIDATREEFRKAREMANSPDPEKAVAGALALADF